MVPVASSLGDWQSRSDVIITRIFGVVLLFVCVAGCVEAFRRGSRLDRCVALLAVLFTVGLAYAVFKTFFYTIVA
jgi:hypothetical protein